MDFYRGWGKAVKISISARALVAGILGVILVANLLGLLSSSATAAESGTQAERRDTWRKSMLRTPRPKKGCFTATYPETAWREIRCKTPPNRPYPPRTPLDTGGSTNGAANGEYSARTPGHFSSNEGSFDSVSGVTSETGNGAANAYSLQLNTNLFTTATCGPSAAASCKGWEQFVYSSPHKTGFIQYWLVNYGPTGANCPKGWQSFPQTSTTVSCWINAAKAASVPAEPIASLNELKVAGSAASAGDSIAVSIESSGPPCRAVSCETVYAASGDSRFPELGSAWTDSEFNIFGDGGGTQASFNAGTTIVVRTSVDDGTQNAPACVAESFTAESNNLNTVATPPATPGLTVINPCNATGGAAPAIVFTEDNFPTDPECKYPNGATACVADGGATTSDNAYSVTCPKDSAVVSSMQIMNNGTWVSLQQHCSDGSAPGACGAQALVTNQFVLGTQKYGVSQTGAAIGTLQTVRVCNKLFECSRFTLSIPQCPSLSSTADQFYLNVNNSPLQASQGVASVANLIMDGPWVAADHGDNAIGSLASDAPPDWSVWLSPGESGAPHSYGLMQINVFVPLSANPGSYSIKVQATDAFSNVTHTTVVPIEVLACAPYTASLCSQHVTAALCGPISDGCGGTIDCGACAAGLSCSHSFCCPPDYFYNTALNVCEPNSCPQGTVYCYDLGVCATDKQCAKADHPPCEIVNGKKICQ